MCKELKSSPILPFFIYIYIYIYIVIYLQPPSIRFRDPPLQIIIIIAVPNTDLNETNSGKRIFIVLTLQYTSSEITVKLIQIQYEALKAQSVKFDQTSEILPVNEAMVFHCQYFRFVNCCIVHLTQHFLRKCSVAIFRPGVCYVSQSTTCDWSLHSSHSSIGLHAHGYIKTSICR